MGNCTVKHQDGSRSALVARHRSSEGAPGFDLQARVSCTCARDALRAAGGGANQSEGVAYDDKDAYATAGTKWDKLRGPIGTDNATDDTDLFLEGLTDVGADAWHNPLVKVGAAICRKGHPLVKLGCSKDWICAGRNEPGGCRSGFVDSAQYEGIERYRCEVCNYNLCQECYRWLEAQQEATLRPEKTRGSFGFANSVSNLENEANPADLNLPLKMLDGGETLKCDDAIADTTDEKSGLRKSSLHELGPNKSATHESDDKASFAMRESSSLRKNFANDKEKKNVRIRSHISVQETPEHSAEVSPPKRRSSLKEGPNSSESVSTCSTTDEHAELPSPEDTDSDGENEQEPVEMLRGRKGGILAAPIEKGKFVPPFHKKDPEAARRLKKSFGNCILFKSLTTKEITTIINTMPVVNKKKGEIIFRQGDRGDALFVVLSGTVDCFRELREASLQIPTGLDPERSANSSRRSGASTPQERQRKTSLKSLVASGFSISGTNSQKLDLKTYRQPTREFIVTREDGAIFGELAIIFNTPRSLSVYAREAVTLGKLEGQVYQNLVVRRQMAMREKLEECLRSAKILETLQDEQIAKLADSLQIQVFKKDKPIIRQGDEGKEFFIVNEGECCVTVNIQGDVQEHCRYGPGDLFGELALLNNKPRAATITAVTRVEVFKLSRAKFERMMGSMTMLHQASYKTDPRKLISDFYRPGDERGPKGSLELQQQRQEEASDKAMENMAALGTNSTWTEVLHTRASVEGMNVSSWFAVFRPTSRDAVAKMLSGAGVGKGLNIKGKSAKKNRLSGFVPFLQISDNNHKKDLEMLPKDSKIRVFFRTAASRTAALVTMRQLVAKKQAQESKRKIHWGKSKTGDIDAPPVDSDRHSSDASQTASLIASSTTGASIASSGARSGPLMRAAGTIAFSDNPFELDEEYESSEPAVFGITMSGPLLYDMYLLKPDLSPSVEWETGRKSEPAFMNMNLHAVTSNSKPKIVLYQHDEADPMNPRGLLIAYAEKSVKPVVSDFDAFLVGSRNMRYLRLPNEQAELVKWCLTQVEGVLKLPGKDSWTTRWLEVLKAESEKGFHPTIPEFGFGDPTSIGLIRDVVEHTSACGAVRHGAECFNYYFPQELDDEYLIVWEGYPSKPWEYVCEKDLRAFLLERVADGFRFPINPVWPVRDAGWYEVLQAVKESCHKNGDREDTLDSWYPEDSGIMDFIDKIHKEYPKGFVSTRRSALGDYQTEDLQPSPEDAGTGDNVQRMLTALQLLRRRDTKKPSITKSTAVFVPRATAVWAAGLIRGKAKKTSSSSTPSDRKSYFFKKDRFGLLFH